MLLMLSRVLAASGMLDELGVSVVLRVFAVLRTLVVLRLSVAPRADMPSCRARESSRFPVLGKARMIGSGAFGSLSARVVFCLRFLICRIVSIMRLLP